MKVDIGSLIVFYMSINALYHYSDYKHFSNKVSFLFFEIWNISLLWSYDLLGKEKTISAIESFFQSRI